MNDRPGFNDKTLNDKFKILLDEELETKKWYEGLLKKSRLASRRRS